MLSGASEKCGSIYKFLRPFDNVHSLLCKMVWKVWRKLFSLVGFNCQMIGCPNRRGWEKFMWGGGGIFDTAFQGWFCTFTFAMFYCIVSMTWVRCTSTKTVRSIWSEGGGGGDTVQRGKGWSVSFGLHIAQFGCGTHIIVCSVKVLFTPAPIWRCGGGGRRCQGYPSSGNTITTQPSKEPVWQ